MMFCDQCGIKLSKTAKFCNECGVEIGLIKPSVPKKSKLKYFGKKLFKFSLFGGIILLLFSCVLIGIYAYEDIQAEHEREAKNEAIDSFKSSIENDTLEDLGLKLTDADSIKFDSIIYEKMTNILLADPSVENFMTFKNYIKGNSINDNEDKLVLHFYKKIDMKKEISIKQMAADKETAKFARQLEISQYLIPASNNFKILPMTSGTAEGFKFASNEAWDRDIVPIFNKWINGEGFAVVVDSKRKSVLGCVFIGQSTKVIYQSFKNNNLSDCPPAINLDF